MNGEIKVKTIEISPNGYVIEKDLYEETTKQISLEYNCLKFGIVYGNNNGGNDIHLKDDGVNELDLMHCTIFISNCNFF